ncbi:MAG: acylneuraminate cytidylyltransferase family protein [Gammaproteobacteria bacterium]
MKILAIIPARKDSKRLPNKNILVLGDKPLICWSIELGLGIDTICDVLVSTDGEEIASIARKAGALVPWLRPGELATDSAASVDVVLHALSWYENNVSDVDGVLLLQPTSPFRTRENVIKAIELFEKSETKTVIGVSPATSHPDWCFYLDQGALVPFSSSDGLNNRSQDLQAAYSVNGCLYLISAGDLKKTGTLFPQKCLPLVMTDRQEVLDIDDEFDWQIAQHLASI